MKYNKPARVLAWLGIIMIVALIIYFLVCAFTGMNFFGSLYLLVSIPVIVWAILFFAGFFRVGPSDEEVEEVLDKLAKDELPSHTHDE